MCLEFYELPKARAVCIKSISILYQWSFLFYSLFSYLLFYSFSVLIAHSQPTCATFGPSGNNIVIAGMVDTFINP